jgi:hypothetical protein
MDVWSPDRQVGPLERIKRPDGGKGVLLNHWRHPGGSWEISDFLLTFLIMDVPGIPGTAPGRIPGTGYITIESPAV